MRWIALFVGVAAVFAVDARMTRAGGAGGPAAGGPGGKESSTGTEILRALDQLTNEDPKDAVLNESAHKRYVVTLKAGRKYVIDLVSRQQGFDPYLRLESRDGTQLAKDDDSGGFPNARIIFTCTKDGPYRVIATSFGGSLGEFLLTVRQAGDKGGVATKAKALAFKDGVAQIDDSLTAEDAKDRVRGGSVCKVFAVKLAGGKTYQIDMTSTKVDSFLRLEDETGKELASDDDGGGFPNARITFPCPRDGTYRLVATTFAGGTGEFTLRLQEQ